MEGDFGSRLCQPLSFTNVLAPPQTGGSPRPWEVTLHWTGTLSHNSHNNATGTGYVYVFVCTHMFAYILTCLFVCVHIHKSHV